MDISVSLHLILLLLLSGKRPVYFRKPGILLLTDPADITALFHMTPYAWKTPKSGVQRLAGLDRLDTQAGFDIHCYQKI